LFFDKGEKVISIMKRWNTKLKKEVENTSIDNFLKEVLGICKKYDFSISHEDIEGAFVIVKYHEGYKKWLLNATDNTDL